MSYGTNNHCLPDATASTQKIITLEMKWEGFIH